MYIVMGADTATNTQPAASPERKLPFNMKVLWTLLLLFTFLTATAQPGSYTTELNLSILDKSNTCQQAKYTIAFSDPDFKSKDYHPTYEFKYSDCHLTFQTGYIWTSYYPTLQIVKTTQDKQVDTMIIKLTLYSQYGHQWTVQSIPFVKGNYLLSSNRKNTDDNKERIILQNDDWTLIKQ